MTKAGLHSSRLLRRSDEFLSRPTPEVIAALQALDGDLMILGAGGKMGPSLAILARRACDAAGIRKRIIGVSRFSSAQAREQLTRAGIETIACDLLDETALAGLPDAAHIVYMAGMKFGATGREPQTWAMNAYLPGRGRESVPRLALRALLQWQRLPVLSGQFRRLHRGDAPCACWRVRDERPGSRAGVRALRRSVWHIGRDLAPELCGRDALRRAAGCRPEGVGGRAG